LDEVAGARRLVAALDLQYGDGPFHGRYQWNVYETGERHHRQDELGYRRHAKAGRDKACHGPDVPARVIKPGRAPASASVRSTGSAMLLSGPKAMNGSPSKSTHCTTFLR